MKTKQQFRQGDVLIERVSKSVAFKPAPKENGRVILAHGEVTGHAHAIAAEDAAISDYRDEEATVGGRIQVSDLEISAALTALKHDEHTQIPLHHGTYRVTRQREYSPSAIRNVAD